MHAEHVEGDSDRTGLETRNSAFTSGVKRRWMRAASTLRPSRRRVDHVLDLLAGNVRGDADDTIGADGQQR